MALRTVDDINPDLLTRLLQRDFPGVRVVGHTVRKVHQGTSTHVHLDVECAGPHASAVPGQLFVKTQLSTVDELPEGFTEALGDGGTASSMLLAEQACYRDIAPELAVETLRVFASEMVPGPGQFIILAEDVTTRGAQFPDPATPQSPEQVASLLRTLAELHAALWESPRLGDGGDLNHLDAPTSGPFHDFLRTGGWPIIQMMLGEPYKKELLVAAELNADLAESIFWRFQEVCAQGPQTLLHGDPHPGNIYVLPEGNTGLLDWQLVRRGSWIHDVGYAIIAALSTDDRRRHERALIAGYLTHLAAAGVADPPSAEEAYAAYRGAPAWGFAMWAITPGQMYSDALVGAVLSRFSDAMRDLDTIGILAGSEQ